MSQQDIDKNAEKIKDRTSKFADQTDDASSDAIHAAERGAHRVVDVGAAAAARAAEHLRTARDQAAAKAADLKGAVADKTAAARAGTEAHIQSSPWKSVAIAAGLGALIGAILHKGKKPRE
jgi:ElaB/YqjD/DUF883 family membrane-anchored ribosome-binding protein